MYDTFLKQMNPNEWELFAEDVFRFLGFYIIDGPSVGADGGKDLIIENDKCRYVVSCKHFIHTGNAVGVSDEINIIERIEQHNATGFIGFYSTQISTSLQTRFNQINSNNKYGYELTYLDKSKICDIIPKLRTDILQKYGIFKGFTYVLNVHESEYKPLECRYCGTDILKESNIKKSIVAIYIEDGILYYEYGCKSCLPKCEIAYADIYQVLHLEQLQGWNTFVNEYVNDNEISSDFYRIRHDFDSKIMQRLYPQNQGTWI